MYGSAQSITPPELILHATCVAIEGKGLLIIGPSGSGKSSLALELMAFGAKLVADDRVELTRNDGKIRASCPGPISGKIEARGVGILNANHLTHVFIDALVNLEKTETKRLPEEKTYQLLGHDIPCYHSGNTPTFPAALLQLLKAGRFA